MDVTNDIIFRNWWRWISVDIYSFLVVDSIPDECNLFWSLLNTIICECYVFEDVNTYSFTNKICIKKDKINLDSYISDIIQEITIKLSKGIKIAIIVIPNIWKCILKRFPVQPGSFQLIDEDIPKQVARYRPPLKVLMCGCRNSSIQFEETIIFELDRLPKYSTIIHGGCTGIDLYVEKLSKIKGFDTIAIPVSTQEWDVLGRAAGPIRNQKMLDLKPDYVIAFHPNIRSSKGTKNMMSLAYNANVPVYIHDLKRKTKFEGTFNDL
jgi:hypothetical protein